MTLIINNQFIIYKLARDGHRCIGASIQCTLNGSAVRVLINVQTHVKAHIDKQGSQFYYLNY